MHLLYFLPIGAIAGWLAGKIFNGTGYGLFGDIAVGIIGGVVGGWIARHFGIGGGGMILHIIIAAAGACLLLYVISLVKKML